MKLLKQSVPQFMENVPLLTGYAISFIDNDALAHLSVFALEFLAYEISGLVACSTPGLHPTGLLPWDHVMRKCNEKKMGKI